MESLENQCHGSKLEVLKVYGEMKEKDVEIVKLTNLVHELKVRLQNMYAFVFSNVENTHTGHDNVEIV